MKQYIVINKITNEVLGKYDTRTEAGKGLLIFLEDKFENKKFFHPFDFELQEKEVQYAESYEDAVEFLGIKDIYRDGEIKTVETTPKHYKALLALSKLFIIAEAWNKEDGFIPDFTNEAQLKYSPLFEYEKSTECFVCFGARRSHTVADLNTNCRFCFEDEKRAIAFGKKFEGLYNDFLMIK